MVRHQPRGSDQLFIETQLGIVTRTGEWFHITTGHIKKFVPGLLKEVSLEVLIRDAQAWVRSADSLALTLLMTLLMLINPWLAAISTLAFHWLWYTYKSALVNRWTGKVLAWMNSDGYHFIIALVALSYLGMYGMYLALAIGIIFFFVFRLGLLGKIWNKLTADKPLTLNDRVLKMVLIRYAMSKDLSPQSIQQMEEQFREVAMNRKNGEK